MRLTMDQAYTLSGFVVGAIVGLTGVGGGSLMTPVLVLLFGVHPATAVGTDLLYAALTKAGEVLRQCQPWCGECERRGIKSARKRLREGISLKLR